MKGIVYIVDDDAAVRDGLSMLLESAGLDSEAFSGAAPFFASLRTDIPACLILDMNMDGMNGLEVQQELARRGAAMPVIFLTAYGDIPTTVEAMKAGAADFLTKPVDSNLLLDRVDRALQLAGEAHEERARIARLTEREREILRLAIAGRSNKEIARELGISYRTVEVHRSRILAKTGSTVLELSRLTRLI